MSEPKKGPRVLVIGGGAIGGTIAAHLRHQGVDVWSLVTNAETRGVLEREGYRLRGHTSLSRVANAQLVPSTNQAPAGSFDYILLAVQPPAAEAAARDALPLLAATGRFVCLQNGLSEDRIGRIVGVDRTYGAVIAWGASMPEVGVFDRTSEGGFTLGTLQGAPDAALEQLGSLLACVGPVTLTANLMGARFSKLAINCAVSTLGTLGGAELGKLLRYAFVRRLALEIISEASRVGRAAGVQFEPLSTTVNLDWLVLPSNARRGSLDVRVYLKHALLWVIGSRYRRMRSSMLRQIENRREPSVDFLNGEVVERGEHFGVPTPVNTKATALVWQIARQERRSSIETLRELYEATSRPSTVAG
jgi:2-dehydropantoate 2-reductase